MRPYPASFAHSHVADCTASPERFSPAARRRVVSSSNRAIAASRAESLDVTFSSGTMNDTYYLVCVVPSKSQSRALRINAQGMFTSPLRDFILTHLIGLPSLRKMTRRSGPFPVSSILRFRLYCIRDGHTRWEFAGSTRQPHAGNGRNDTLRRTLRHRQQRSRTVTGCGKVFPRFGLRQSSIAGPCRHDGETAELHRQSEALNDPRQHLNATAA